MKIKKEHYAYLLNKIDEGFEQSSQETIDFIHRRLTTHRWSALLIVVNIAGITPWIVKNLYPYMNDKHIISALRRIVKELGNRDSN